MLTNPATALIFEEPHDLPRIFTDDRRLSQILRNFIGNAVKFTEAGEIRVQATADGDGQVTFAVTDTGIGIAPADQEKIFEEFYQVRGAQQAKVRGTGLGLPLSRKLAGLLGGHVAVASTVGAGSTFSVTIPARYAEPRLSDPGRPAIEEIQHA